MKNNFDKAWEFAWNELFCEKTNTFYDYKSSLDKDGLYRHLPNAREVLAHVPNPCSWNTGMEDGAIMAGVMLETIAERYNATNDEALHAYAEKVINGLKLLTSVAGIRGFLARNVLLEDGKYYCYSDTSRDQYTHVIFGTHKYMQTPLCTDEERELLCDMLVSFAEYAEKCVTAENGYRLLRTDGGKGFVTCMLKHISPHEQLRLPMFYISAWKASGNPHWLDKYKEIRDETLEKSFELKTKYWTNNFCLGQMQDSIRLCYDLEPEEAYKKQYEKLANQVADFADLEQSKSIVEDAETTGQKFDHLGPEWRKQPMTYLYFWGAPFDGLGYYMPDYEDGEYKKDMWDLQHIGVDLSIQLLCPNRKVNAKSVEYLNRIVDCVDFEKHATRAVFYLLSAYWTLQAQNH